MRKERTEVLVIGAGPVGLYMAILLAEDGIETEIVDVQERTTARSYACALHAETLSLLQPLGLTESLVAQGRKIETIAFYDHETRRAEVRLDRLSSQFPFLLILPQNGLETALEQRLRASGVAVNWRHRFDALTQDEEEVSATIEELGGTSTGYIIPHWETVVQNRATIRAQLLVGADGQNSFVRQRLGISSQHLSGPHSFAAFEFEADEAVPDEVRVVLDDTTTNVLWPLPGNRCRWTFQMSHSGALEEFPEKERRAVRVAQPMIDERIRRYVEKVARQRAPWFRTGIKEVSWCTEVAFFHRLAERFGRQRCWLAGDAAHQTGPVGVQSMNAGIAEAKALATAFHNTLSQQASLNSIGHYDRDQQAHWRGLLGLADCLRPRTKTSAWVRGNAARLLPCLPATGAALAAAADQLELDYAFD
jgi:2-polyprenyl-6-methoxyphenol hydroxylase-like FAD-dependent oxidoreductase